MDSKSEEIYYLLYRLFELNLIQTSDYDEDRFDEITDYIEKNGVDKSYKNEAYKLAMQYINHNFSNGKEYKEIIKKFLDLFGLQVNTHSVEWNIISESKKSARNSIKESINYEVEGLYFFNFDVGETCSIDLKDAFNADGVISEFYKNENKIYSIVVCSAIDYCFFISYNYRKKKVTYSECFSSYQNAKNKMRDWLKNI